MDHAAYQNKVKNLPIDTLRFIIKDCHGAINAMPDNPKNGYYADEINYCAMEINRRTAQS